MAEASIDIRKVSRWMGHANINTTDSIYTHLFDTDHEDAIRAVDALSGYPQAGESCTAPPVRLHPV